MNKLKLLLSFAVSASLFGDPLPWNEALKQDPQVVTGCLDNGLCYYIFPKKAETNTVSLRLLIHAGAAMETELQDGMAHFIEHMTFNGTKNFAPGTLIHYFQNNGMVFGNDTNAFTHYLHTCYQIDLPKNEAEEIAQGLAVLRDQGFECLFLQKEIDRERGVILSEMRARDSVAYRSYKSFLQFIYPKAIFSKRFVIGTEKTILSFKSEDFFEFYRRWYTPERMSIIITGNIKSIEVVKKQIEKTFNLPKKNSVEKDPDLGEVGTPAQTLQVKVFKDKELPQTQLMLLAQHPCLRKTLTLADMQKALLWSVIEIILKQRLDALKDRTELAGFEAKFGTDYNRSEYFSICFSFHANAVIPMLKELEMFTRSIAKFGFSEEEIRRAKEILKGNLDVYINAERNETAKETAERFVSQLMEDALILSAEQKQAYFQRVAESITPEACQKTWNDLWSHGAYLFVSGPLDPAIDVALVKETFLKSQATSLEPKKSEAFIKFQSPFKGDKKAEFVKEAYEPKLGYTRLCLQNNIRVNLKKTEEDKDRILVYVGIGKGLLDEPCKDLPGLSALMGYSFLDGGLEQCSCHQLKQNMEGKKMQLDFDVDADCYAFKSETNQACFKEQMQILCAYLQEPGYREEGLLNFRKRLAVWSDYFTHTPEGVLQSEVPLFLACNDMRFGYPPDLAVFQQRTFEEAKRVLTPVFKDQYMEVTLVGDFDINIIKQQLLETLGQLELRSAEKSFDAKMREVAWPQPQTKEFVCDSVLDKAILSVVWPTESALNQSHARILEVLRAILQDRLFQEIRQILGDTYSPHVVLSQSQFFNRGSLNALLTLSTAKLDDTLEHILKIADAIATQGVTQEELMRAKKPIIETVKKKSMKNVFWLDWLKNIQINTYKQDWALDNTGLYEQISREDVNRLAQQYLKRNLAICVKIKPTLKSTK